MYAQSPAKRFALPIPMSHVSSAAFAQARLKTVSASLRFAHVCSEFAQICFYTLITNYKFNEEAERALLH
jgi:hypothetical protein